MTTSGRSASRPTRVPPTTSIPPHARSSARTPERTRSWSSASTIWIGLTAAHPRLLAGSRLEPSRNPGAARTARSPAREHSRCPTRLREALPGRACRVCPGAALGTGERPLHVKNRAVILQDEAHPPGRRSSMRLTRLAAACLRMLLSPSCVTRWSVFSTSPGSRTCSSPAEWNIDVDTVPLTPVRSVVLTRGEKAQRAKCRRVKLHRHTLHGAGGVARQPLQAPEAAGQLQSV